ncbi:MAG: TrbI/VirB10 family protein [Cyanobacteria bacterium P01_A01_bin.123]
MSSTSEQSMTTEELRELTNAPAVDEPLVTPADFEPDDNPSIRPIWKMPLPKLGVIAILLIPVFGLAGYFLVGGRQGNVADQHQAPTQSETAERDTSDQSVAELDQLRQENETLKANSALDGQAYLVGEKSAPEPRERTEAIAPRPEPSTPSPPRPSSQNRATSPTVVSSHPTTTPADVAMASSPTHPPRSPTQFSDPTEHWQYLSQLGSYGSLAASPDDADVVEDPVAKQQAIIASAVSETEAQLVSTRLDTRPANDSPILDDERKIPSELPDDISDVENFSPAQALTASMEGRAESHILHEAEAVILEGASEPPTLTAGTTATGQLATPLIFEDSESTDRFVVVLTEPLKDAQSRIVLPVGSQLLVQVDQLTDEGLVDLSVAEVVWTEGNQQHEVVLPEQALQIRGEDGSPIIADRFEDYGAEMAMRDMEQFLLGAARRTAELYTRSATRVQTSGSSTVITESNPAPNILAGVLEGGTDAILDTISERNQQAMEALQDRPDVRFVEAGRPVQIFVNQSVQLPI